MLLVFKETIKNIIIKYDELFTKSVVKSLNFEDLIDKISCNANVISACINGQVAGYCAYYMNDFESREAYITLIAVDEDFRANHLGTIMLDYIKAVAVVNGFSVMIILMQLDFMNIITFVWRTLHRKTVNI